MNALPSASVAEAVPWWVDPCSVRRNVGGASEAEEREASLDGPAQGRFHDNEALFIGRLPSADAVGGGDASGG